MYGNNPYITPGMMWVRGMEGAKSFQTPINSNLPLFDQDNEGIFYIKSTDNLGMSKLRIFKYEEISDLPMPETPYITKSEVEGIVTNILNNLLGGNDNGKQPVSAVEPSK